ncbi:hypothetical protein K7G98_16890 [Saccharothrix sp. MB29]|nr:hypothetical protein [Saccharothrix sp. MB29]
MIATDVALVDARAEYAEPATGHGAAAVLLGDDPAVLAMDLGAFAATATRRWTRPPDAGVRHRDVDRSLFAYLDCLANSFADYADKVEDADFVDTFDHLVMHTVRRAGRRAPQDDARPAPRRAGGDRGRLRAQAAARDGVREPRGQPMLRLGLPRPGQRHRQRRARRGVRWACTLRLRLLGRVLQRRHRPRGGHVRAGRIAERLDARVELTFAEYDLLLKETLRCLVPVRDREVDLARWDEYLDRVPGREPMLVLSHVEDYHRQYEWR